MAGNCVVVWKALKEQFSSGTWTVLTTFISTRRGKQVKRQILSLTSVGNVGKSSNVWLGSVFWGGLWERERSESRQAGSLSSSILNALVCWYPGAGFAKDQFCWSPESEWEWEAIMVNCWIDFLKVVLMMPMRGNDILPLILVLVCLIRAGCMHAHEKEIREHTGKIAIVFARIDYKWIHNVWSHRKEPGYEITLKYEAWAFYDKIKSTE